MVFDVSVAMTWLLFLALFPISFFWLRRAWQIGVRRDFSQVALKAGSPPPNPARYAPYEIALNLIAGGVIVATIGGIIFGAWPYDQWSAFAGSTIWMKLIIGFAISRHAHWDSGKKDTGKADSQA